MELRLTVEGPGPGGTDLVLDVDPAGPVGDLARCLAAQMGQPANSAPPALHLDGIVLDVQDPVGRSPIRDGLRLGLGRATRTADAPQGIVEVRCVGGPGAGAVWRLGPGEAGVGGGAEDRVRLADPAVPAGAMVVEVDSEGGCTVRMAGGSSARLEGEAVEGPAPWSSGHLLALGRCLLTVATPTFPDASVHPAPDGGAFEYSRPPRLAPPSRPTQFALPAVPRPGDPRPLPWVMAIVPLIGALVMAKLFGNLLFLAFAVLSPISLVANHFSDRKHGRRTHAATLAEYRTRRANIESDVADALAAEQRQRRHDCPDPAEVASIATGPRQRLWERRCSDADWALLRVGTASMPSAVTLTDPDREEHRRHVPLTLPEVPVSVSLGAHGVLGVAGRTEHARALARWLLAQSAVLHSPSDLSICVLTDRAGMDAWAWSGWLPHTRARNGQAAFALIGSNGQTTARRIAELLAELGAREAALRAAGSGARLDAPDILVVLDGSRRLRSLPGLTQILSDGPALGIRSLCLDTEVRLLPEECSAVVEFDDSGTVTVRQTGVETVEKVRPDLVEVAWGDRVGRALAPIRDVTRDDDSALPSSCRLLDVLEIEPPTAERIVAGWATGGRTTRAVIGASLDGEFPVDLAADGPHGLVAGTTGSGKSELLQSLIASLAVANRPDAMTFLLVDYKGGSAFGECARLPHTIGLVTDLDTQLVTRALDSLSAELRRHEHLFARAGVPALAEYETAQRRDPGLPALPRLTIVIDEFASLARELPDFVTGLVNVAQRGRSLGIHLILATQRPSGVVSPEIRANTNLRIALRVTDTSESADVIDAPDAARIPRGTPGRGFARLGHNTLLPFQTGRVAGRRPGLAAATGREPFVTVLGPDSLGLPPPTRPGGAVEEEVTDLTVLVEAIREAAESLNLSPQFTPWLPALPDTVLVADLPTNTDVSGQPEAIGAGPPDASQLAAAPFALVDRPADQARETWALDLATFGHLYVAGAARTGRSQTLRTIATALAGTNSAADVHLYGLDCGNGALLTLRQLPHCGAVVRSGEPERAKRLLERMLAELRARALLLGELHVTDISEQRARAGAGDRLPHLVLLIDRWEGFVSSLGEQGNGALTDVVLQLVREGAGAGIHVVIAGDHTLLGGRVGALTENKLVLRLADKGDYSMVGIPAKSVPDNMPPGRGYRAPGGHQVQVALLDADASGAGQVAAIERVAAAARDAEPVPVRLPFGVDELPARIGLEQAWPLRLGTPGPLHGLVAVGGDRLAAYGPDLAEGIPTFLVAGPARSGRSTALRTLAASFVRAGTRVLLVAPRPSPLREPLGGDPDLVVGVLTGPDVAEADLAAHLDSAGPLVVLVDDAEMLRDCAAGSMLTALVRRELGGQFGLAFAGDADSVCVGFTGWQVEARKARRGLLLSPQNITDGDLVGIRLGREDVGGVVQPGRGILHLGDGMPAAVQVAVAPPEAAGRG